MEYIDNYHDKSDVVNDLKEYLTLLSLADRESLTKKIEMRLKNAEGTYDSGNDMRVGGNQTPINIKLLRWRVTSQKLCRILGVYSPGKLAYEPRQKLVLEMFRNFCQFMEHHPQVLEKEGIGSKHQANLQPDASTNRIVLSDLDLQLAQD